MTHFCPNMPLGVVKTGKKENLHVHQKWPCTCKFCEPNFQEFRLKWWRKELFCIVGTSWMGWGRLEWYWHMEMSYLTSLNPQLVKNIAYVGLFARFSVQLFVLIYFATWPRPALTAVRGGVDTLFKYLLWIESNRLPSTIVKYGLQRKIAGNCGSAKRLTSTDRERERRRTKSQNGLLWLWLCLQEWHCIGEQIFKYSEKN